MSAREMATLSFWRNSRALFQGSDIARQSLKNTSECFKADVSNIQQAASNSLLAAEMRAAR